MVKEIFRKTILTPLQKIINDSRSVGIILFCCTIISLTLSNMANGEGYLQIWNHEFHYPALIHLPHSILAWINDGLMASFFFMVGMEIKREIIDGELSSVRNAILPVAAALGGMLVPALIYTLLNNGTSFSHGWGIPMATDIAFSLGIASLLGKRVPASLKIFLTALAIIDDLGAILVIAIFYSGSVQTYYLLAALCITAILFAMLAFKVRFGWWNFLMGLVLWYCIHNSGIHATIGGVIFAFSIPKNNLERLERFLHIPVNFMVLPIFALANTAILLPSDLMGVVNTGLSWGIILGLVIGKPLGIVLASYLLVKMKWGDLPQGVSWTQLTGVGMLAGIGFTMSIFIAFLAFEENLFQDVARIGVLLGSAISMVAGYLCLYLFSKRLTQAP
jgi:NhaA family Na+:H+ antiporter